MHIKGKIIRIRSMSVLILPEGRRKAVWLPRSALTLPAGAQIGRPGEWLRAEIPPRLAERKGFK